MAANPGAGAPGKLAPKDSTRTAKDTARDSAKAASGVAAKAAPKAESSKSVKVALHLVLRIYEPGRGIRWTGRYLADTKAFAELQGGRVPSSFLREHLAEAVNPILVRVSQDAALGRGLSD